MWPKHFRTWKDIENIEDDYKISAVDLLTLPTKTYSFSSPIMDSHISMIVYEGLHTFCHYPYSSIIIKRLLRHRMI